MRSLRAMEPCSGALEKIVRGIVGAAATRVNATSCCASSVTHDFAVNIRDYSRH